MSEEPADQIVINEIRIQVLLGDAENGNVLKCDTGDMSVWEVVGLLTCVLDTAREGMRTLWLDEDDED